MTYSRPKRWMAERLEADWEEMIAGRSEPVPQPKIIHRSERRERMTATDILEVSGGSRQSTPASVSWAAQRVDERVSLDIRTDQGSDRLYGVRLADGSSERYGGILGEVTRILDSHRKGYGTEYDLIDGYEVQNLDHQAGPERHRCVVEVEFSQRAVNVWTDPNSTGP